MPVATQELVCWGTNQRFIDTHRWPRDLVISYHFQHQHQVATWGSLWLENDFIPVLQKS